MFTDNKMTQDLLDELIKVGVGGKYRDKENYLELVTRELKHEEAMLRGGVSRYNDAVNNAVAKGQESTTKYGIGYQQKYITKLCDLIHTDILEMFRGGAGNRVVALTVICQCLNLKDFEGDEFKTDDSQVWDNCALIVLRNVIDGISSEITANKLAIQIANGLEMEAKLTLFEDRQNDNYNWIKNVKLAEKNIAQRKSRYRHKKNVWTYYMNKNNLEFDNWAKEDKVHIGARMLGYVEKLGLIRHQNRKTHRNKTTMFIEATPKILEEIRNFNITNEALFPKFRPMLMPPRDWSTPFTGGYYGKKFNQENKPEDIINALQFNKSDK